VVLFGKPPAADFCRWNFTRNRVDQRSKRAIRIVAARGEGVKRTGAESQAKTRLIDTWFCVTLK
jgi:hypothetical protein